MRAAMPELSEAAIREQLRKVLASRYFVNSDVRTRFLNFVVEETHAGHADQLSEIVLGVHLFKPDYDPRIDNHVRRHAPDVRKSLKQYYETDGSDDLVVIEMPVGGYKAVFLPRPVPPPAPGQIWWIAAAVAGFFLLVLVLPGSREFLLDEVGWLPSEKHVAVLAFRVAGSDQMRGAFAEGLREALVAKLKQAESFEPNLWVVPTDEMVKEKVTNAHEARRAFRATLVLSADMKIIPGHARLDLMVDNAISSRTLERGHLEGASMAELHGPFVSAVIRMLKLNLSPKDFQLLNSGSSSVPDANTFYVTALGYLRRGRDSVDEAIGLFTRAVEADPEFALAHAGLAEGYLLKHGFAPDPYLIELAEKSCNTALQRGTALAPLHLTLGRIYYLKGRYNEAAQEYWKALGIDPNNVDGYRRLGFAQEKLLKHEEAERAYQHAIALHPEMWSGYLDLGVYYYRRGRLPDAETQFLRAAEIAPDNRLAYTDLAAVYIKQDADGKAEKALNRCLAIRPDKPDPNCMNNLGNLFHFQGRHEEAAAQYERAIQVSGPNAQRLWNLSAAYRWSKQAARRAKAHATLEQALQHGLKELERNPRDAELHARVALCYAHLDQIDKALDEIRVARELDRNAVVLFQSVRVFERTKRRDDAIAAHRELCAMNGGRILGEIRKDPDLADFRTDLRYKETEASRKPG